MKRATNEEATPTARVLVNRLEAADEIDLAMVEDIVRETFTESPFAISEELGRPWSRLWAARFAAGTEPVGFLVAWHVADELHVLNIATRPALRRRGVARALMDEALTYAAAEKIRILILEVRRSNRPAIKLYRGLGFTALGVRPGYYSDNNEDAIEMMLTLDPETGRIMPGKDEIRIDG
ncbi:Ribosomal-protein-S18p-alanine acetyltransferase [Minicystis rosea]|nr:Ribosomal-protein-S18p-alanine acetyltransferase [Minicystis rosea]